MTPQPHGWSAEKADRLEAEATQSANAEDLEVLDAIVDLPALVAYRERRHPDLGTSGSYLLCPCVFCRVMGARADLRARMRQVETTHGFQNANAWAPCVRCGQSLGDANHS